MTGETRAELEKLRAVVRRLPEGLPRCDFDMGDDACFKPAQWESDDAGDGCFCDEHHEAAEANTWKSLHRTKMAGLVDEALALLPTGEP